MIIFYLFSIYTSLSKLLELVVRDLYIKHDIISSNLSVLLYAKKYT